MACCAGADGFAVGDGGGAPPHPGAAVPHRVLRPVLGGAPSCISEVRVRGVQALTVARIMSTYSCCVPFCPSCPDLRVPLLAAPIRTLGASGLLACSSASEQPRQEKATSNSCGNSVTAVQLFSMVSSSLWASAELQRTFSAPNFPDGLPKGACALPPFRKLVICVMTAH